MDEGVCRDGLLTRENLSWGSSSKSSINLPEERAKTTGRRGQSGDEAFDSTPIRPTYLLISLDGVIAVQSRRKGEAGIGRYTSRVRARVRP